MKTKKDLRFFILMNKTLEFSEIKTFLSRHRYVVKAIKEVNEDFISELNSFDETMTIVLIGFKMNNLFPGKCEYISSSSEKTVYEKLLSFLYLKPDDRQKLIILNQKEGMKGLYKACICKDKIEEVRSKEYTLQGITKKDLLSLEEDFKSENIKNRLYQVTVGKERFKSLVIDRAILLSRGLTKYLDVLICFRDGSPSYYFGDSHIAYCLYDEFNGIYDGNYDWTAYKGRENVEEVKGFLNKLYAEKAIKVSPEMLSYAAAESSKAQSASTESRQTVKVIRGKKRK